MDGEDRVELMVTSGQKVIQDVISYVENELNTHIIGIVGAFSGGDDSIVATHAANAACSSCVVFNADTRIGLGPARTHIDATIAKHNWTAEVKRADPEGPPALNKMKSNARIIDEWTDGETAYEEFVLNHGVPGPAMHPRMYQRLKERQLNKLRNQLRGKKRGGQLSVISGIRHDESSIRAGYKRAWHHVEGTGVVWVNPFYYFTAADFELYRQEFGLGRNPVKRLCGISGECCCGTFANSSKQLESERAAYRVADPSFAEYLDKLEQKVRQRFPWHWGEGPPQWWKDEKAGQGFFWPMLPDEDLPTFQPMCVGCNNGRR